VIYSDERLGVNTHMLWYSLVKIVALGTNQSLESGPGRKDTVLFHIYLIFLLRHLDSTIRGLDRFLVTGPIGLFFTMFCLPFL
jgi:hypothetical protein